MRIFWYLPQFRTNFVKHEVEVIFLCPFNFKITISFDVLLIGEHQRISFYSNTVFHSAAVNSCLQSDSASEWNTMFFENNVSIPIAIEQWCIQVLTVRGCLPTEKKSTYLCPSNKLPIRTARRKAGGPWGEECFKNFQKTTKNYNFKQTFSILLFFMKSFQSISKMFKLNICLSSKIGQTYWKIKQMNF